MLKMASRSACALTAITRSTVEGGGHLRCKLSKTSDRGKKTTQQRDHYAIGSTAATKAACTVIKVTERRIKEEETGVTGEPH